MEELTLEQLQARLAIAESEKAEAQAKAENLTAENKKLSAVVDAVEEEKAKTAPVQFETADEFDENGKLISRGGTYEFTCPTFTWDDGSVINVRELAKSDDQEKYENICAHLVDRKSGIIRRKEA